MVGDRCGAVGESQRQDAGGEDVEHFFHVFVLCEFTYDGMSKVELGDSPNRPRGQLSESQAHHITSTDE